ncbi:general secretion pathway protein L [Psychrobacter sp. PL15]|uniref:type II secretion system protein GspL n=1 Tax=Psychrobacter sp. PL15 TaxID=3071719 RepID=UPI002E085F1C|nr:general secretion pathway protein L [Psychrobacter sp. PL15]
MLHVWLRAQNSPLAVWHADTKQWQSVDSWQQLHDVYSSYKTNSHKTLCLYFPSSHLLQVSTELSFTQLKQLGTTGKQYLFEETSLAPVEQLAVRQISYANSHYLYALAQSDIETWQQSATLAGLTVQASLPDFLLLPIPEEGAGQQVVLYQDEHTTILRQSSHQGLAVSYLPLIFERLPQLSDVCVLAPIDSSMHPSSTANIATETAELIVDSKLLLTSLAATPTPIENPERHALNFFVKSSDSQLSPYLRVAMMVALSALVLQIATDGVQWYRYSEAAVATKTEVAAQYQSWFPNEALSTRTKLQAQVQPKLRSDSQAPASHMAILARVSPLIKQSSLRAQSLVMEPNALSFTLIAPNRDSLDQFASTLMSQGLNANLERVNSNGQGQFSGQITVNLMEDGLVPTQAAES